MKRTLILLISLCLLSVAFAQQGQAARKPQDLIIGKWWSMAGTQKITLEFAKDGAYNTTARWAVEGKIGDELIGGMVHEMNVPYIIADLQLPPVGSKEVEEELPAPSRAWARLAAEVAAAILLLGVLVYFFIFWRRRRDQSRPTGTA